MTIHQDKVDRGYREIRVIMEDIWEHQTYFKNREECITFLTFVIDRFRKNGSALLVRRYVKHK